MKTNYKAPKAKNDNIFGSGQFIIYYNNFNYREYNSIDPINSAYNKADQLAKSYNNIRIYARAHSHKVNDYMRLPF